MMAISSSPSSDPCKSLDEFLMTVKKFYEHPALKEAESFATNVKRLTAKVNAQEQMMLDKADELLRVKQELKQSKERWDTEHPEKIGEVLRVHRDETHKILQDKNGLEVELDRLQAEAARDKTRFHGLEERIKDLQQQLRDEKTKAKNSQDQISSLKQGNAKLEADLSKANDLLRGRDEIVKQQKAKIEKQEKSRSDLADRKADLEAKLREQVAGLKQIQGFAPVPLVDNMPDVSLRLKNLWLACYKTVSKLFDLDVALSVLEDPQSWRALRDLEVIPKDMPFPPSNTTPAKGIRTAALMAVLSESLVQHIFTPTYLLFDDEEVRDIMFRLATTEADRGKFFKRVLNGTCEDKQEGVKKQRIDSVLERVVGCVGSLLEENARKTFRTSLSKLLSEATDLWSSIQRKSGYFESDVAVESSSQWKWLAATFTEQGKDPREHEISPDHLQKLDLYLVLFPRVYVVTDSVDQPVFPGMILSATEIRAAKEEWDRVRQSHPMLGRSSTTKSMRPRRMTVNQQNNGGRPFLG